MKKVDLLFTAMECVKDPKTTGFLFKGTATGIPDWPYMWVAPSPVPVLTKEAKANIEKNVDKSIRKSLRRRLGNATWEVKVKEVPR